MANDEDRVRRIYIAQLTDAYRVFRLFRDFSFFNRQTYLDYWWTRAEDDMGLFGFERCCHILGLEPGAVRAAWRKSNALSDALENRVCAYALARRWRDDRMGPKVVEEVKRWQQKNCA